MALTAPLTHSPELVSGCTSTLSCNVITPYGLRNAIARETFIATNNLSPQPDWAYATPTRNDYDTTGVASRVYAVWSVFPEPNTALLIGMGFAGLGWRGRAGRR